MFGRYLYYLKLRRYHCAYNFYNSLPTIRKANFKWYGLNSVKNTLLRSSTFLFQLALFLDLFLAGTFSKTIFYKKFDVRSGKKYMKISNSLSIAGLSTFLSTLKFLLKLKLTMEVTNVHIVKSGRVKLTLDLKNVLLGLFKLNLSAREINIDKLMLVFKLGSLHTRELEVFNFIRIFNSSIREGKA